MRSSVQPVLRNNAFVPMYINLPVGSEHDGAPSLISWKSGVRDTVWANPTSTPPVRYRDWERHYWTQVSIVRACRITIMQWHCFQAAFHREVLTKQHGACIVIILKIRLERIYGTDRKIWSNVKHDRWVMGHGSLLLRYAKVKFYIGNLT